MSVDIDLRTRFGRIRARVGIPDAPMRLAELAWNTLPLDGRLIDMAVKADLADAERSISCTKGCGACCRQLVMVSPPEAFMIADVVAGMPPERQRAVLERFATVNDAVRASPLGDFDLARSDAEGAHELSMKYFELGLPCPFLEDESCSIHPQRPSLCREYLVTSPATECAQLRTGNIRRVPTAMHMGVVLARVAAKVLDRPMELVPLSMAIEWAAAHAEDGARTWNAPVLFQAFLDEAQAAQLT